MLLFLISSFYRYFLPCVSLHFSRFFKTNILGEHGARAATGAEQRREAAGGLRAAEVYRSSQTR